MYDVKIDTKKNGGMVKRRAGAAKRGVKKFKGIL